jgi:hypothetical protein
MEHWNHLRAEIDCQSQPQNLVGAAPPCSPFVHLEVRELEVTDETLVQGLNVLASAGQLIPLPAGPHLKKDFLHG